MQAPASALPMTATQSLHTTNLKFRMITLPNLPPISCIVESAIDQVNNFFSLTPTGTYLFEQKAGQMYVCVQSKLGNNRRLNKIAVCIDFDGVEALFSIKGEEKRELFQAFAERLGLTSSDNLEEKRALAISKLNLRLTYADPTYDLMLTPSESYIKHFQEIEVEKPFKARHTFMLLTDPQLRGTEQFRNVYLAMFPILICVDSTLSKQQLDELFMQNTKEDGHCYFRFSEKGSNKVTYVSDKIKIALNFSVMTSCIGNRWLNWGECGNLPAIIFQNRQHGYKSTSQEVFGK